MLNLVRFEAENEGIVYVNPEQVTAVIAESDEEDEVTIFFKSGKKMRLEGIALPSVIEKLTQR